MKGEGAFLDFRGMKVWYHVEGPLPGPADTPPLLLLHGGPGGTSDGFEPFDALAETGRTIIRYDELGSGRSDRPRDLTLWTPATFVDLLSRVRDELGLKRVHLLGWSWGGMLIMEYFRTNPSGVASVVLTSAPASLKEYVEDAQDMRRSLPSFVQKGMDRFESKWSPPPPPKPGPVRPGLTDAAIEKSGLTFQKQAAMARPWVIRVAAVLNRVFPRSQTLYDMLSLPYVEQHLLRTKPIPLPLAKMSTAMSREVYETMWGPSEFFGGGNLAAWSAYEWLPNIDVPTLVTCGRCDTVRPERAQAIADRIRGAELVVFEQSGHCAMFDEPDLYFRTLTEFLAEVDAQAR